MNKKFKKLVFGLVVLVPLTCHNASVKAQHFGEAIPTSSEQLPLTWWDSTSRFDRQITTTRKENAVQEILSIRNRYNDIDTSLSISDNYVSDNYYYLDTRELPKVREKFGLILEWESIAELNIIARSIKDSMFNVYNELSDLCLHKSKWSLSDLEAKINTLNVILNNIDSMKTEFQDIRDGLNNKKFSKLRILKTNYFVREGILVKDEWFVNFVDE